MQPKPYLLRLIKKELKINQMKTKVLLLIACLLTTLTGFAITEKTVDGDGNVITKEISISDYNEISTVGVMEFVYEQLKQCYGFKDLYRAKEKYSPTVWEPSYYAYLPKIPSPDMFYAVVKIQNPQGILDFFQTVKFPKSWDHGQKKQETEAKKDHE